MCNISTVGNEKRAKHTWCAPRLIVKDQRTKFKNREALFALSQSNDPEVLDLEAVVKSNETNDPEVLDQGVPQECKPEINTKSVIKLVQKQNEISDQGVPSERQLEVVQNENAVSDQDEPRECQLGVETENEIKFA